MDRKDEVGGLYERTILIYHLIEYHKRIVCSHKTSDLNLNRKIDYFIQVQSFLLYPQYLNQPYMERILNFYSTELITCRAPLNYSGQCALIISFCIAGLLWAVINVRKVLSIDINTDSIDIDMDDGDSMQHDLVSPSQKKLLVELGEKIADVPVPQFRALKNS